MLRRCTVPRTLSTVTASPHSPPNASRRGFLLSFLPSFSDSLCQLPPFNVASPCVAPLPDAPLCARQRLLRHAPASAPLCANAMPPPLCWCARYVVAPFPLCRAPASASTPLSCTPRQCAWPARCVDTSPACALHQCSFPFPALRPPSPSTPPLRTLRQHPILCHAPAPVPPPSAPTLLACTMHQHPRSACCVNTLSCVRSLFPGLSPLPPLALD